MKISKGKFRHLLSTAIHQATKGKTTPDLLMAVQELEAQAAKLRAIIASRPSPN